MEARCGRRGVIGLGLRISLQANHGRHGRNVGNRRRSGINLTGIGAAMARTHVGAAEIPVAPIKVMRPRPVPAVSIAMGMVVIGFERRFGLGSQGA